MRAATLVLLLVLPAFAGCAEVGDFVNQVTRPDLPVARSDMTPGELHTHNRFQVVVQQPDAVQVRIEAKNRATGEVIANSGLSNQDTPVSVLLTDGAWDITYWVADHEWETLRNIRVDATPPVPIGLERIGDAAGGSYTIGDGVSVDATRIEVIDMQTGALLATNIPYTVTGLHGNAIRSYMVAFGDDAGNWNNFTIQVRVGEASALPAQGEHTFGIVARYRNEIQLWDIADLSQYVTPGQAQAQTGGDFMGGGFAIEPEDPVVVSIVDQVLDGSEQTTAEIAWKLFQWMFDELDYDDARLSESDLLRPRDTVQHGGGVCRDLAALYVSLLRASGVPSRIVSGYLAGNVNGFHAWVEFYGGAVDGQAAWVPVDVSPIDGAFEVRKAMSAFGIQRPDYLTLRTIPSGSEVEGWSTALGVKYTYYGQEPVITFEKDIETVGQDQRGVLCVDVDSRKRAVANTEDECDPGAYRQYIPDFVVFTERIIDYGILVRQANAETEIRAEVAYPFAESVEPNEVDFVVYGDDQVTGWTVQPKKGSYRAVFTV